jgi:hypothetical protein
MPSSWRDIPAADLFPLLPADELKVLGENIRKHGLHQAVVIFSEGNGNERLLDGRNRLDAMEHVGIKFDLERRKHGWWILEILEEGIPAITIDLAYTVDESVDPYEFVISANIHRRQLSPKKKRELIKTVLKAQPEKSNRQVAKTVGVSHPHVAAVRAELEKAGDVETVTTSIDTKGRKQQAHKPAKAKRRDVDDYVREKKARLAVVKTVEAPESGTLAATKPAATVTITDAPELTKPMLTMSEELTRFEQAFSARVSAWSEVANPDNPNRKTLAGLIEDAAWRMMKLAQTIAGGGPANNGSTGIRNDVKSATNLDDGIPPFLDRRLMKSGAS